MPRRRLLAIQALILLTIVSLASGIAASGSFEHAVVEQTGETDDHLLAGVQLLYRPAVALEVSRMSRYTIVATFLPPDVNGASPPSENEPVRPDHLHASPSASPAVNALSPSASPVILPLASPEMSLQQSPSSGEAVDVTQSDIGSLQVAEPQIAGAVYLHYVNDTGQSLDDLYIRLYPNLQQYGSGRMVISNVEVDGKAVIVQPPDSYAVPNATPLQMEDAGSRNLALVRLPLGKSLAPNESTEVRLNFSTTVPIDPPDENGFFRYSPDTGTWTLAHWFPMLAGYTPGVGWEIDPPAAWSDIAFSNTALFDLTLQVPEELTLVTSGVEVESQTFKDERVARITTGPVRDVAILAAPGLGSSSTDVNGVTITSWFRYGEESGAQIIRDWAAQALEVYSELFGPYPYTTLDIVPVPNVIGFEFPQLISIGSDFYPDPASLGSRPGAIEFLVAHEIAHQWWYGLVGSNPHRHAYLDEGLTEYSTILYFEAQYGEIVADAHLRNGLIHRYAFMLITAGDYVADQPTATFPDSSAYYATAYRKAGLGFEAIRRVIGDDAFFQALKTYTYLYRFGVALPADLRSAFETASGRDLGELWSSWFNSDHGQVGIVIYPIPPTPALSAPTIVSPGASQAATMVASPIEEPDALNEASSGATLATPSAGD